ncbi:MAG TPA: Gfo/Idh/MocA family oxidoreductase [Blastocatellia bacterium]|nr:Gfo/Idh/MocA family oxidoreductase [Blastocatellia bacterium]
MINVGVIGAGHFGREHARVYSTIPAASLSGVCDTNEPAGISVARQYGAPYFSDYREMIGKVDAVSLAVPTVHHCAIACDLLAAGIAVLVEKPISQTIEEAGRMIEVAARANAILQAGHLERFNPAVIAASRIVTRPLFFEVHRLSVFTPRSLDIDVVMDLMIHDIDIVLSFVKGDIADVRAAGVPVLTPRVDIASARLEFENGCVANLTASRVSSERVRKLRFFQPHEYVSIDYSSQEAAVVRVSHKADGPPEFEARPLEVNRGEPLRNEIESFLAAVSGAPVAVTAIEARRALEVAIAIADKVREHAGKAGVPFAGM